MEDGPCCRPRLGRWPRRSEERGRRNRRRSVKPTTFLTLALSWALAPASGWALQDPPPDTLVTVEVRVVDVLSREPLSRVEVRARELGMQAFTDAAGRVTIPEIPVGAYFLEFERDGYEGAAGVVQLQQSGEVLVELLAQGGGEAAAGEPRSGTGGRSVLAGRVVDAASGEPLDGARVNLPGLARSVETDEEGRFVLSRLLPGEHAMEISRLGYATRWESAELGADQRVEVEVALSTEPIELEPIEVRVEPRVQRLELAGFYQRRMLGFGQFLAQEQIEASPGADVSDLFTNFSGIRWVDSGGFPRTYHIALTRPQASSFIARTQRTCFPAVWIDDVQLTQGGSEPADLNRRLTPEQVAGIEVYSGAGQVPTRYGGTGRACGVILIWTRGGP